MTILDDIDKLPAGLRFVVAVGVFDGVHRGHQEMLKATVRAARAASAEPVVITFDPHPDEVLRGSAPPLLADPSEKLARLAAAGIGSVVIQPFNRQFAEQTADAFLHRLADGRQLCGIVMSDETAFGRDRQGTLDAIDRLRRELGCDLVHVRQLLVGGERVSSSRIRTALQAGKLGEARRLLGRPYAVIGEVVRGDGRGRELGFPTANLKFDRPVVLPSNGIYAVRASWAGPNPLAPEHRADGVASLGVRPTFGTGERLLEVYLLDFEGDLYGVRLRIEFVRRQRSERKFGSPNELVEQMKLDAARARAILAGGRR